MVVRGKRRGFPYPRWGEGYLVGHCPGWVQSYYSAHPVQVQTDSGSVHCGYLLDQIYPAFYYKHRGRLRQGRYIMKVGLWRPSDTSQLGLDLREVPTDWPDVTGASLDSSHLQWRKEGGGGICPKGPSTSFSCPLLHRRNFCVQ